MTQDSKLFDAVVTVCTGAAADDIRHLNADASLDGLREEIDACLRHAVAGVRKTDPDAADEEVLRRAIGIHRKRLALKLEDAERHNERVLRFARTQDIADRLAVAWLGQIDHNTVLDSGEQALAKTTEDLAAKARLVAHHLDAESRKAAHRFSEEE